MDKTAALHWAEIIDSWRVFPRLFLGACFAWCVNTAYILILWYIHLPGSERGVEASGFGAVVLSAQLAFLKLVFDSYVQHGRDWNAIPASSSSTTITTQTNGAQ